MNDVVEIGFHKFNMNLKMVVIIKMNVTFISTWLGGYAYIGAAPRIVQVMRCIVGGNCCPTSAI